MLLKISINCTCWRNKHIVFSWHESITHFHKKYNPFLVRTNILFLAYLLPESSQKKGKQLVLNLWLVAYDLNPNFQTSCPVHGHITKVQVPSNMVALWPFSASHIHMITFYSSFDGKTIPIANHCFILWPLHSLSDHYHKIQSVTWLTCFITIMTYSCNGETPFLLCKES